VRLDEALGGRLVACPIGEAQALAVAPSAEIAVRAAGSIVGPFASVADCSALTRRRRCDAEACSSLTSADRGVLDAGRRRPGGRAQADRVANFSSSSSSSGGIAVPACSR
jgi:hypothetical protein